MVVDHLLLFMLLGLVSTMRNAKRIDYNNRFIRWRRSTGTRKLPQCNPADFIDISLAYCEMEQEIIRLILQPLRWRLRTYQRVGRSDPDKYHTLRNIIQLSARTSDGNTRLKSSRVANGVIKYNVRPFSSIVTL